VRDDPRTLRELWQRLTPVQRCRLLAILGTAALTAMVALAAVAGIIALLL